MDIKPIAARVLGALVGLGAVKLNAKFGVQVDAATQASIVVAIYGALHTLSKQFVKARQ